MTKIDKRQQILINARKCFIEKGYSGTSLRDIAYKTKVPIGLIYYYFANKQELWIAVKQDIAKNFFSEDILSHAPDNDLRSFLEHVITKRFKLYCQNPEIIRLLQWQALEDTDAKLSTMDLSSNKLANWIKSLQKLQSEQKIRQDWSVDAVLLFINSTVSAPFLTHTNLFNNTKTSQQVQNSYLNMILEILYKGLNCT